MDSQGKKLETTDKKYATGKDFQLELFEDGMD